MSKLYEIVIILIDVAMGITLDDYADDFVKTQQEIF